MKGGKSNHPNGNVNFPVGAVTVELGKRSLNPQAKPFSSP
jgi:hypothetical protein